MNTSRNINSNYFKKGKLISVNKTESDNIIKELCPDELYYYEWKSNANHLSKIDNDQSFVDSYYNNVLKKLDVKEIYEALKDYTLLCDGTTDEVCPRHIVAEWLYQLLGIDVQEVSVECKKVFNEVRPKYISCLLKHSIVVDAIKNNDIETLLKIFKRSIIDLHWDGTEEDRINKQQYVEKYECDDYLIEVIRDTINFIKNLFNTTPNHSIMGDEIFFRINMAHTNYSKQLGNTDDVWYGEQVYMMEDNTTISDFILSNFLGSNFLLSTDCTIHGIDTRGHNEELPYLYIAGKLKEFEELAEEIKNSTHQLTKKI